MGFAIVAWLVLLYCAAASQWFACLLVGILIALCG
jgi:hypothetical protein